MTANTKSAAAFLDQLIADPLNPELCRRAGIEIISAPTSAQPFPCACPARLHCASDTPHLACEVCDECHSAMPATCLSECDLDPRASDDNELLVNLAVYLRDAGYNILSDKEEC